MFGQLRSVLGQVSVSLHLVEVSPALSRLQAQRLTGDRNREAEAEDEPVYRRGETDAGLQVSWYRRLEDVPPGERRSTELSVLIVRWRDGDVSLCLCLCVSISVSLCLRPQASASSWLTSSSMLFPSTSSRSEQRRVCVHQQVAPNRQET